MNLDLPLWIVAALLFVLPLAVLAVSLWRDLRAGRTPVEVVVLFAVTAVGIAGVRCTSSGLAAQAAAANTIAEALNHAAPVVLDTAEREALDAGRAAAARCMSLDAGVGCRGEAHAAYHDARAKWRAVAVAWDAVAVAHDEWRHAILRCRADLDAGTDCPAAAAAASAVANVVTPWRCALRAVGRADMDPIPGAPVCRDGGAL